MIDCEEHVDFLEQIGGEENVVFPICMDIDMSSAFPGLHFCVRRSSITEAPQALAVWNVVRRAKHVRLDGVMGYEAQIAGVQDRVPGSSAKNMLIAFLKRRSLAELRRRRAAIVEALRAEGCQLRFVNGGGTGSVETTIAEDVVTEVAVGSGFYSPTLFDHYAQFRHLPAAGFAIEVVRQPTDTIYTCHGGGYIASGPPGRDRLPAPYLPQGAELLALEGAGEVQTPVRYTGPEVLTLGDPVFFRHAKAGELCERFNTLLLLHDGRIVNEVPTYRGEGQCFV
jgi:D-serine deaminase-like pyridoxal phosphate-dependent protein